MSKLTVHLEHDQDIENPNTNGDGQWTLYSFCSRHTDFKHPDHFDIEVSRNEVGKVRDRKLKRKLANGLAHWLGYFEHGQCCWFRTEAPRPGVEFRWDGVRYAGLLIWEHKASEMGAKTYEDRAKDADAFLNTYTSWANGEGLFFAIEDEAGETIESSGGFYGCDASYMLDEIAHSLVGHEFVVKGDADYLESELRRKVKAIKSKSVEAT